MTQRAFAADRYGNNAPDNYEKYFVPAIGAPVAHDLIEAASLRPGERVLDVACGTGVVTRLAAERVGDGGVVAGLDVNAAMLDVAREHAPSGVSIDWYETSAEAIPLSDEAFDVVLCQMGLQFVPNKLQALAEMRRVLQPGGRILLNLPGPTPPLFVELANALSEHVAPQCAGFVHAVFALHDGTELKTMMTEAGLSQIEIHRATKTLHLPPPHDFLWQYVCSTPLVALVAQADDAARHALTEDVAQRWEKHVTNGDLTVDVEMTTVNAIRPA
jgi:ubiquinone/menaquinone biosynthesis C-methylase UbiE